MCHTGHNPHDDTSDEAPIVCDLDASTLEVSYIGKRVILIGGISCFLTST